MALAPKICAMNTLVTPLLWLLATMAGPAVFVIVCMAGPAGSVLATMAGRSDPNDCHLARFQSQEIYSFYTLLIHI